MLDYINVVPIPLTLREFVEATLRAEPARCPDAALEAEIDALEAHGIVPLLFATSGWPLLKQRALHAAALEALRLADLRKVLNALEGAGRPLILKGTALAYSLYPAPELRPRSDTDLLIDRRALDTARDILIGLGFSTSPSSGDELGMRQVSFWRTDSFGVEHTYDLHWAISNHAVFADVLGHAELCQRAIALPRIGDGALGLSLVDALLLACIHRIAHHHGSERLIWMVDIHLIRKAMALADHERFWALAEERQVVAVCSESIRAAAEWFGEPKDDDRARLMPVVRRREPSAVFLDRTRRHGALLLADVTALSGWRARWRRLTDLALPPRAFMSQQFGTASPFLLPFLYAFRAARGVTRLFRRVA